jgi:hypothetical protein
MKTNEEHGLSSGFRSSMLIGNQFMGKSWGATAR